MNILPNKIDVRGSAQTHSDRKLHGLSEYVIISQKLWCFDDNIIEIPILIFAFHAYRHKVPLILRICKSFSQTNSYTSMIRHKSGQDYVTLVNRAIISKAYNNLFSFDPNVHTYKEEYLPVRYAVSPCNS